MSDLETLQSRDIADLARALGAVPRLADQVVHLGKQAQGTSLLTQDIGEMALAACEAELRSMKAIRSLIDVLRALVPAGLQSNVPMQALTEAAIELDSAEARINKAIDVIQARSTASVAPP